MRLKVLGMSVRDAAVFDFFMQKNLSDWYWEHVPARQDTTLNEADVCIIDMAALGWAEGNEQNLTQLNTLLGSKPAVLLVSAHDRSWSNLIAAQALNDCVLLSKPYGAMRMREVLLQFASRPVLPRATGLVQQPPASAAVPQAHIEPLQALDTPHSPDVPSSPAAGGGSEALASLLADESVNPWVFLRRISEGIATQRPFEARFTVQNFLIVNPAGHWAATNIPLQVIASVCQSNALAAAVTFRALEVDEAEERAERLAMRIIDLDVFLHDLLAKFRFKA